MDPQSQVFVGNSSPPRGGTSSPDVMMCDTMSEVGDLMCFGSGSQSSCNKDGDGSHSFLCEVCVCVCWNILVVLVNFVYQ